MDNGYRISDFEVEKQMMNNEVNGYRKATAACWPSMRLWLFEMAGVWVKR